MIPTSSDILVELSQDPKVTDKHKVWPRLSGGSVFSTAPASPTAAASAAALPTQPSAKPNPNNAKPAATVPGSESGTKSGPRKRGKVPTLRSLAIDCMATNLLLYDGIGELPVQYRAPIFLSLIKKQELSAEHLKVNSLFPIELCHSLMILCVSFSLVRTKIRWILASRQFQSETNTSVPWETKPLC